MSDVVTGHFGRGKQAWRWAAAIIVVVVLGLATGLGARWYQMKHHHAPVPVPKKSIASAAQDRALNGDYQGAQDQIAAQLAQSGLSADDKYILYYQQGANYQNNGDNKSALESYKQAAAAKKTQNVYESLGAVAHLLGDDTSAIAYYKQAIQLIPPNTPLSGNYKSNYEQIITQLGGQP